MMFAAQAIASRNALLYSTFDRLWTEGTSIVAGNNGGVIGHPEYVRMGDGAFEPLKIPETRGIILSGGQYCYTDIDFSADEPFSIAILTDCPMEAAGWFASTFRTDTNIGMRFGASAPGTLVAELRNAGGSLVKTMANAIAPTTEKRLFVLTYNGAGCASALEMHVDNLTLPAVSSGTSVTGSISSGEMMNLGAQSDGANPSDFMDGRLFAACVFPFVLDMQMRRLLRETLVSSSRVDNQASYTSTWTPLTLVQQGNLWMWSDHDTPGTIAIEPQPSLVINADFSSDEPPGVDWTRGADWTVSGGQAVKVVGGGFPANAIRQQIGMINGNRYLIPWDLAEISGSSIGAYFGSTIGPSKTVPGTYIDEGTATGANPLTGFNCTSTRSARVNSIGVVKNLSFDLNICRGNLGDLYNVSPSIMPWLSDPTAPDSVPRNGKNLVYGLNDYLNSTMQNFLHSGDCTLCLVCGVSNSYSGLLSTGGAAAQVGIIFRLNPASNVYLAVRNGSGVNAVEAITGVIPVLTPLNVLIMRLRAASYSVRLNGVSVLSGVPVGALSGANSEFLPRRYHNRRGSGEDFRINRYLTDQECILLEAYMKDYYAIP